MIIGLAYLASALAVALTMPYNSTIEAFQRGEVVGLLFDHDLTYTTSALKMIDEEYGRLATKTGKRSLFKNLLSLSMETSTLDDYVFRLKQIRVHLKANHDVDLDGDLVLSVFLAGLGDRHDYSPIKIVLEAKDDVNLEEAIKVVKNFQLSTLEAKEQ